MSRIVYSEKGRATLASGLNWSVLSAGTGWSKGRAGFIRKKARLVEGTRYVLSSSPSVSDGMGATYIGLFVPDALQAQPRGALHSLALVFLEALLSAGLQRSLIHAMLSIAPSADPERRAVVVIEAGNIVHDQVESRQRVAAIAAERIANFPGLVTIYSGTPDIEGATLLQWSDLVQHAHKGSTLLALPTSPLVPLAVGALLLGIGGATAYHYMVRLPQKQADAARVIAASDKTGQYQELLEAELAHAGWDLGALSTYLQSLRESTLYADGWALKSLQCEVERECKESWTRVGGLLTDLLKQRPDARYLPQESTGANLAVLTYSAPKDTRRLAQGSIPANKVDADVVLKPVMQHLINGGQDLKTSEFANWPPGPVSGVRSEVLVQRRKVEIVADYHFVVEALQILPESVLGQSFELVTSTPIKVTIKGHQYAK